MSNIIYHLWKFTDWFMYHTYRLSDWIMYHPYKLSDWISKWEASEWAAFGQILGAIATVWAVLVSLKIARDSSSPKIKVTAQAASTALIGIPNKPETYIYLKAVNHGNIAIKLERSYFLIPQSFKERLQKSERKKVSFPMVINEVLPALLQPAESVEYRVKAIKLAEALSANGYSGKIVLNACFIDTLGRYYSSKLHFNVDKVISVNTEVPLQS